jgi:hypothetical protein
VTSCASRKRSSTCLTLVATGLLLALIGTFGVGRAHAAECANEALRVEAGAKLPDCRAYEQVTPSDKGVGAPVAIPVGLGKSAEEVEGIEGAHAAVGGQRIAWVSSLAPLAGAQTPGLGYLSTRGEAGWSSENVIPAQSPESGVGCPLLVGMAAWSSDLSRGILADGYAQKGEAEAHFLGEGLECGHDEPRLVEGEPEGFRNLFVRNNEDGSYELVNVTPSGVVPPTPPVNNAPQFFPASFLAGSTNLSHVVFEEELPLVPQAPAGDNVYEWSGGTVGLVTVLPDGTAAHGQLAGATRNTQIEFPPEAPAVQVPGNIANFRHAVSGDGSRVFFEAEGNLYVREDGTSTVQLDVAHGAGPGGGGKFMAANEPGSLVVFVDDASAGLTPDTVPGSGQNLYEYDLASGKLIDLTPATEARVAGVSGVSEDGAYVYFAAEGALTEVPNSAGDHALAGQPNLYLIHSGVVTFIAGLNNGDGCDWTMNAMCVSELQPSGLSARVSANGRFIGFPSGESLTGYDNTDLATGQPDAEVFLYDAGSNSLACASCDPTGARPTAPGIIRYPALPDTDGGLRNLYPQRNVSDNGQVFFESANALLPGDSNGKVNVYEWEINGSGSCREPGGCRYSISSGTSEADSYFLDASVSGNDVFFVTAQRLLGRDRDDAYDIYDARAGGGFPEPQAAPLPCSGEDCRGAATAAPGGEVPASSTITGSGQLTEPAQPAPKLAAPKPATRAQKLAKALKTCSKKPKRKRAACRRRARRLYGPVKHKAIRRAAR